MRSLLFSVILAVMLATLLPATLWAQSQEKMYALTLVSLARGTNWPDGVSKNKIVIGVWEYLPLANELSDLMKTRNASGKMIEVKHVSDVSELAGCDVLFLPSYKQRVFPGILEKVAGTPVLVVSNHKDLALKGGCVDIILVNGKLNYEINCKAIEKRGLKVSNAVKNMGTVVGG